MSIQSQINRIAGNVTAALTAIGNKGVTVPSGSDSDDLADLIAAIPAARIGETDATNSRNVQTISFTVNGEPTVFACVPVTDTGANKTVSLGTARIVTGVIKYGNNIYHGMQVGEGTTFALRINQVNATYSNGTFTLSITAGNGGNFFGGVKYRLLYVY